MGPFSSYFPFLFTFLLLILFFLQLFYHSVLIHFPLLGPTQQLQNLNHSMNQGDPKIEKPNAAASLAQCSSTAHLVGLRYLCNPIMGYW